MIMMNTYKSKLRLEINRNFSLSNRLTPVADEASELSKEILKLLEMTNPSFVLT